MTSSAHTYPAVVAGATAARENLDDPGRWSEWHEALAIVTDPAHLRRTFVIALVVGTALFAINHLDLVLRGEASPTVWLKVALTYVVPFFSSNLGVLAASRRSPAPEPRT